MAPIPTTSHLTEVGQEPIREYGCAFELGRPTLTRRPVGCALQLQTHIPYGSTATVPQVR